MPFIRPHGYLAIGSTDSGNAIAIEIVTGRVNVCSHEVFSEKGIGGWNDDCTKWVQTPISPDAIAARAEESFESISAFLDRWIDSATRLLRDGTA
jgi:hypothetical protein